LQKELRGYNIFNDNDIIKFCDIYYSGKKQDSTMMGKMTSALKPVADRYNEKKADERYNFRRQVRSFIKWYGYISQVCRMFDENMQKEYVFCAYLIRLIPSEPVDSIDLDGALKLEFYKLEQTFKGEIELINQPGVYEPASGKGKATPEPKEPLEEVIEKINALYNGKFTDADRVLLSALHSKLIADKKLMKNAISSDPQVFTESIFPRAFENVAQNSYIEANETYSTLFADKHKYNAIMSALCEIVYREMRNGINKF
jgi:type I restriction enzyme R subunit